MPGGEIVVPEIRDAERLQGFDADWTEPATANLVRKGGRWKLVGNAVNVRVARWVGEMLTSEGTYDAEDEPLEQGRSWPTAAWGVDGVVRKASVSSWPIRTEDEHLADFLKHPTQPLSARATEGFLRRAQRSSLRFPEGFLDDVRAHGARMDAARLAA